MNDSTAVPRADAFAALRYPDFRRLIGGSFMFTIALQMQEVVIGYKLYLLTHQPLVLGLIGLAEALPFIALALFGGHIADRGNRKVIMRRCIVFILAGSLVLLWALQPGTLAWLPQNVVLTIIYGVIAALGLARGFLTPATNSLKPFLVPRELYPNSAAWSSVGWQSGAILGPAAAGFAYAAIDASGTLIAVVVLIAATLLLFATITTEPPPPPPRAAEFSLWDSLREGIKFVAESKILLYSSALDLFSVLFGGVVAILPVYATDILKVGAEGFGLLRAAPAVGAMLTVLACTRFPPTNQAWRNLLVCIAGFGVATLVFGISTNFWLSMAALFLTGAFDSVGVVIRGTILQVMPPDHLRGRVLSVNSIFVTTSNELGAFESGVAAQLLGTVPSVVIGGSITLLIVAWVWTRSKALFDVKLV